MMMQYNFVTQKMELFEETINEASMIMWPLLSTPGSYQVINFNMLANEMFNVDEEEMDISEMRSKILDEIGIKIHEDVCSLLTFTLVYAHSCSSYQTYHHYKTTIMS
jgi:hypothetical protein